MFFSTAVQLDEMAINDYIDIVETGKISAIDKMSLNSATILDGFPVILPKKYKGILVRLL